MGLLETMPAYYVLKWVSPASLHAGGFGNDMDTPLAMLKDGYGAIIEALVGEVDLDVRLSTKVLSITRTGSDLATLQYQQASGKPSSMVCDLIVLSGPIPHFVAGSIDGKVLLRMEE